MIICMQHGLVEIDVYSKDGGRKIEYNMMHKI
jgi:hypothetical protein